MVHEVEAVEEGQGNGAHVPVVVAWLALFEFAVRNLPLGEGWVAVVGHGGVKMKTKMKTKVRMKNAV